MRIVSKKKIVDFCRGNAASKTALEIWYKKVNKAEWEHFSELKRSFPSADFVGNHRVVFNIKGNDFRLIAIVIYISQKVYIRWIGTHSQYNKIIAKNA
jgi:mRNA interferase HigB